MWEKIKKNLCVYAVAIAIPLSVGLLSALLTKDNMNIYTEINIPPLSPPSVLFPIAWTVLYVLMGISSAIVYTFRQNNPSEARSGLILYIVSLLFNFGWSIIFFNIKAYLFSFVWLLMLLFMIVKTALFYSKVKPISAYLQIPYIAWVAFAGYLNLGIWILN